jgi:hypothetical protein
MAKTQIHMRGFFFMALAVFIGGAVAPAGDRATSLDGRLVQVRAIADEMVSMLQDFRSSLSPEEIEILAQSLSDTLSHLSSAREIADAALSGNEGEDLRRFRAAKIAVSLNMARAALSRAITTLSLAHGEAGTLETLTEFSAVIDRASAAFAMENQP